MPDPEKYQLLSTDPEGWKLYLEVTQPVVQPRDVVLGKGQVDAQARGGEDWGGDNKY